MKTFFHNYTVYSDGRVFSNFTKRFITFSTDKDGYLKTCLYVDKKPIHMRVHRLVAICFLSNEENKLEVNHKDGNKKNNDISNLEWCTNIENIRHAIENGLRYKNRTKEQMKDKNRNSQKYRYSKMSDIDKEINGAIREKNKAFGANYMASKSASEKYLIAQKKIITSEKNKYLHMSRAGNAIIIDNIEYKSINEASERLAVSFKYIKRRVISPDYKNYYLKEERRHDSWTIASTRRFRIFCR